MPSQGCGDVNRCQAALQTLALSRFGVGGVVDAVVPSLQAGTHAAAKKPTTATATRLKCLIAQTIVGGVEKARNDQASTVFAARSFHLVSAAVDFGTRAGPEEARWPVVRAYTLGASNPEALLPAGAIVVVHSTHPDAEDDYEFRLSADGADTLDCVLPGLPNDAFRDGPIRAVWDLAANLTGDTLERRAG